MGIIQGLFKQCRIALDSLLIVLQATEDKQLIRSLSDIYHWLQALEREGTVGNTVYWHLDRDNEATDYQGWHESGPV